jgi:surfactin synthase thioesterase subunit
MDRINVFCLPFAGGSKYSYRGYTLSAPPSLNIIPLEIPGRGARSGEALLSNLELVAGDIFDQIKNNLHTPYVIYGHSMGGLLGYLVTKKIIQNKLAQPLHLFFTGCGGPSIKHRDLVDHTLPKKEFYSGIRELGGSTDEVLNDVNLMDFFEPILRADFEAVATFQYKPGEPFQIPISIVLGLNEKVKYEEGMAWQRETTELIEVTHLPGNHFFIFNHEATILGMLCDKLQTVGIPAR